MAPLGDATPQALGILQELVKMHIPGGVRLQPLGLLSCEWLSERLVKDTTEKISTASAPRI